MTGDTTISRSTKVLLHGGELTLGSAIDMMLAENDEWTTYDIRDEQKTKAAFVKITDDNAKLTLAVGLNRNSTLNLDFSNLSGVGTVVNQGIIININSDESVFEGLYRQTGEARLNVYSIMDEDNETSYVFSGEKHIIAGRVYIERTKGIDYNNFKIDSNITFMNSSKSEIGGEISNEVISFIGERSVLEFNKHDEAVMPEDKNRVEYTLKEDIYSNEDRYDEETGETTTIKHLNTIQFVDSYVMIAPDEKNYNNGNTEYIFRNSTIKLSDYVPPVEGQTYEDAKAKSLFDYNFTTLISDRVEGKYTADLDFDIDIYNLDSDTLTLDRTSSGYYNITNLNIIDIDQNDIGVTKVLYVGSNVIQLTIDDLPSSNVTFDYNVIGCIASHDPNNLTDKYSHVDESNNIVVNTYDFIGKKAVQLYTTTTTNDSIELYSHDVQDTLKAVNQFDNTNVDYDGHTGLRYTSRIFKFAHNDRAKAEYDDTIYKVRENLGETAQGDFYIVGRAADSEGIFHDTITAKGYELHEGNVIHFNTDMGPEYRHSLFEVTNDNTRMTVQNVTIKDAIVNSNTGNASVFDITSTQAQVKLQNVVLKENEGNAIYNAGRLTLVNTTIEAASSETDKNSFVNAITGIVGTAGKNFYYSDFLNNGYMLITGEDTFTAHNTGNGTIKITGTANIESTSNLDRDMVLDISKNDAGEDGVLNINDSPVYINNLDTWTGRVNLNAGHLTYSDLTSNGNFLSKEGTLDIVSGVFTSNSASVNITETEEGWQEYSPIADNVLVTLYRDAETGVGAKLILQAQTAIDGTIHQNTILLDDKDAWYGDIELQAGRVILTDKFKFSHYDETGYQYDETKDFYTFDIVGQLKADNNSILQNENQRLKLVYDASDASGLFTGTYEQNGADSDLIVTKEGILFGGTKNINAGDLHVTTADVGINYERVNLGNEAELFNYATSTVGGAIQTKTVRFVGNNNYAYFGNDKEVYPLPEFGTTRISQFIPQ